MRSLDRFLVFLVVLSQLAAERGDPAWGQEPDRSEDVSRLFAEIRNSERQARYEAEQTVYDFSRDRVMTSRFRVQYAYPYRRRETVDVPEGGRCIMLEDGKHLWSYFPARRIVVKEPLQSSETRLPLGPADAVGLLSKNYRTYTRGTVSLRGGTYQVVEFLPRWQDRPRREIWLEDRRKVPVRVYISRPDGRPTYRSEFDQVHWDAEFAPDVFELRVPQDTRVVEVQKRENLSLEVVSQLLNRPMRLPTIIPLGYLPYNIILRSEEGKKRLQVVYTDGLSSFSVFFEWLAPPPRAAASRPSSEAEQGHALEAFPSRGERPDMPRSFRCGLVNVVTVRKGDQKAVCVGDVQEEKLKEIAASLQAETPALNSQAQNPEGPGPHLDR